MEEGPVGDLQRRLQSACSALLGVGVERVQTDVPIAGGRLRSKRDASIVQHTRAGDIGSGGTSRYRHRDVRWDGLLFLSWRSSTCRMRATGVEEAFIGTAEPELLTYALPIEYDTTAERATHEAYILTLILSCDYSTEI